jgi:hypothetical protein
MDDDTSNHPSNMQLGVVQEENLVLWALNFIKRCHFCGRLGEIVSHFPRRRYGNRTFEGDFQTIMQEG